ncbi:MULTISPECIES: nuclear transport factor 2 family protein [Nocardia]|uniref:Nuclear transport factor 2 family protein n=2 Tax=Nocardia TaxID=1817 RepID=A0A2T2ZAP1_9NOCA|nr:MULTISPECIES: nuclear transport factor 2 family protein [Nocardia]MBF6449347.1 nuclear transport factor 2 family protein [Nocardia elegans]PSR64820.1 nuclear transport factor 2 family protein [Nocardia nova]
MTAVPAAPEAWIARETIRDLLTRVARGEDRRDAESIRAAFWPDATVDFGIFAGSFDDYLAWVTPGAAAVVLTQHVLGQTLVELDDTVARAETHVTAYHRVDTGGEHRDLLLSGRYLDRFERRAAHWRIVRRVMLYDWTQDLGVSADWSRGLMGAPFSAGHFTGRTKSDHSTAFFERRVEETMVCDRKDGDG